MSYLIKRNLKFHFGNPQHGYTYLCKGSLKEYSWHRKDTDRILLFSKHNEASRFLEGKLKEFNHGRNYEYCIEAAEESMIR